MIDPDGHRDAPGAVVAGAALPGSAPRPGWATWAGLAVVLAAAAVLSFSALRELAVAVQVPVNLAFLLPLAIDGGVAVSCRAWLSRRVNQDAEVFARRLTVALLMLTVALNAAQQGMAAHGVIPPWWVAVLVGAVPPAVVGGVVHLMVLAGRSAGNNGLDEEEPGEYWPVDHLDGHGVSRLWEDAPPAGEQPGASALLDVDRAEELIAAGAGRRRLARELGVTEHTARQLLARNGSQR